LSITDHMMGEEFTYSGAMIVMRDAAQKRLFESSDSGSVTELVLKDEIVFYAGPIITEKRVIIGPTTSARMDKYLGELYERGVIATVGKGPRTAPAVEVCRRYRRPYLVAPSGVAAFLSTKIERIELIAYPDLGPEAVYRIFVRDFPLLVAIDKFGNNIFERWEKR